MKIVRFVVYVPERVIKNLVQKLGGTEQTIDLKVKLQDIAPEKLKGIMDVKQMALRARAKSARKDLKRSKFLAGDSPFGDDGREIIKYWNNSEFITYAKKNRDTERRNFPTTISNLNGSQIVIVKRAITMIGVEKIKEEMDKYFAKCLRGAHIWDRTNHGFKSSVGFLAKLVQLKRTGGSPWWENDFVGEQDEDPRVTQMLADLFANRFLGQSKYNIAKDTKEHRCFIKFRRNLKKRLKTVNIQVAANVVFGVLAESYTTVYPAQLCSKTTWTILIPQYLKKQSN